MSGGAVIIGAGECGVRAAFGLREAGFDGAVTLIGEEPHLPYERPPLSKQHPVAVKPIVEQEAYAKSEIQLVRGYAVEGIDRDCKRITLETGEDLVYDTLLLAVGARSRIPRGMEGALTLRTVDDAEAIVAAVAGSTRVAIVGGGFIGLELAATARTMGVEVVVIEAADRLMARAVPVDIASVAEQRHRDAGIEIRLSAPVSELGPDHIQCADGRRIEADAIIVGVGAVPNTELARSAGLAVDNGITVDGRLQTSDPAIFAAGDCCNFPWRGVPTRLESWRAAQDQGSHVGGAMVGRAAPYSNVPWFWSDQHDLTLQIAGLPCGESPFVRRDLADGAFVLFQTRDDGSLAAAGGIGKGNAVARDVRLAEMIIERGTRVDPAQLSDASVALKALLKG